MYASAHVMCIVLVFTCACIHTCVPAYTSMFMYIFICMCVVLTCMCMFSCVTIFDLCIYMSLPFTFVFLSVVVHLCKGFNMCMYIHALCECSVCACVCV